MSKVGVRKNGQEIALTPARCQVCVRSVSGMQGAAQLGLYSTIRFIRNYVSLTTLVLNIVLQNEIIDH